MIPAQNVDRVIALPPQNVASATVTSAPIDTLGYHYASLVISSNAASGIGAPSALQVQECDTAGGAYTPVPATVGGAAYPIPAGSTAVGGSIYAVFNLDLRRRKRFLQVALTNTVTQTLQIAAELTRADVLPVGTTTPGNVGVAGIVVTA